MRGAAVLLAGVTLFAMPGLAADDLQIITMNGGPSGHPDADWSGFYLGTTGGYGWIRDEDFSFAPPLVSHGDDWIFGVHGGYMHAFGPILVGVEASYSALDILFDGFPISVDDATTLRVRAGFAAQQFLVSAHGGATYATTNIGLADWGYNLGLAVEYMVSQNITAGLQYDYHGFTSFDGTLIDAELQTLLFRVGYKF